MPGDLLRLNLPGNPAHTKGVHHGLHTLLEAAPQYQGRLLKIAIPFTEEQRKRFDAMTDDELLAALAVVTP